jgi:glyceraldehyde-3-phosphate dehydrogenase (ferredoxin)
MVNHQKVLFVDPATGFSRMKRYRIGDYFGPVDLGLHISGRTGSLNIGVGLFAGSIFPGSNRLFLTGFSPCWRGFFVSSLGGAGLVFDNLGINMVSLVGKAPVPSLLYLNRNHGEEIQIEVEPLDVNAIWKGGRGGVYALLDHVHGKYAARYENDPRILVVGPAAQATDFGAIVSVPLSRGKLSFVDTWAGRGGLGSKMLQEHGIAAIVYGGTHADEDFRDRKVADEWFVEKYRQKLAMKDFEGTTKYRFDPKFDTGGTFGVNYATMGGRVMAFNYRTIHWSEEERLELHERFIVGHYLKQFNEETIRTKQQATCGEPCAAVCKKMNGEFKKDYEPYQTLGPLCGIFDQRAAERLNHHGDASGFDAISLGGVLAWLMDCLDRGLLCGEDLGVTGLPRWDHTRFDIVPDSLHNAELGSELIEAILHRRGILDLSEGIRKWGRTVRNRKGTNILDHCVYNAFGRKGWMVPNQYWTPGVLAPMAIMGKYYIHYGADFLPPRELGRQCADRLRQELIMDNTGICRFHRAWAEEMMPTVFDSLYGLKDRFLQANAICASRINSRNAGVFWESEHNVDYVLSFLRRKRDSEGDTHPDLLHWLERFEQDRQGAALDYWFEVRKGIDESLRDFN